VGLKVCNLATSDHSDCSSLVQAFDASVECGSAQHRPFAIAAVVLLILVVIPVPLVIGGLLYRVRNAVRQSRIGFLGMPYRHVKVWSWAVHSLRIHYIASPSCVWIVTEDLGCT
jgi:hypothetical protein